MLKSTTDFGFCRLFENEQIIALKTHGYLHIVGTIDKTKGQALDQVSALTSAGAISRCLYIF